MTTQAPLHEANGVADSGFLLILYKHSGNTNMRFYIPARGLKPLYLLYTGVPALPRAITFCLLSKYDRRQ